MIYVSSSCVNNQLISTSVQELADQGYRNIELSGGTEMYPKLKSDLLTLKEDLGLNYLLHNYFPPPTKHFVLNLASMDSNIRNTSIDHCKKALDLSAELGGNKYAVHAGFLIDIPLSQIGKRIEAIEFNDRAASIDLFLEAVSSLQSFAPNEVSLYIENNVISSSNYDSFGSHNPLLVTDYQGYKELQSLHDFNVLVDVAHLKVSCQTLELDFATELASLISLTDYVHVSDNDGKHDTNNVLDHKSILTSYLKKIDLKNKIITLEVYDSLEAVQKSNSTIKAIINA